MNFIRLETTYIKVHPRTGHKGPEREQMYSSSLPSTSAQDGGRVVNATP